MATYRLVEGTDCFYVVDENDELQGSFDANDVSTPDGEFFGLTASKAKCNAEIFLAVLKKADGPLTSKRRQPRARAGKGAP